MKIRSQRGSFSSFIAIIITSVIVLMNILLNASIIRSGETLVTSVLVSQQDLILSEYSEILYDRYGLFATGISSNYKDSFYKSVQGIRNVSEYNAIGIKELKGKVLSDSIIEFSKQRFPVFFASELLNRFTKIRGVVKSQSAITPIPSANPEFENPNENPPINYFDIIKNLIKLKDRCFPKATENDGVSQTTIEELELLLTGEDAGYLYEPTYIKDIKSSLTITEKSMSGISSFIENLYQIDTPDWYDRIALEYYISGMFSCKTNFHVVDGVRNENKDLKNRNQENLCKTDNMEIEKIIFGSDDPKKNESLTRISIQALRMLIHIITNFTDSTKLSEIKATSASLCATLALASGGTVIIDPALMEVVIIILKSASSAISDYEKLVKGEGVNIIPVKCSYNLETYYKDYLQALLLVVPLDVKLKRVEAIIKSNTYLTCSSLFAGVKVSCNFRNTVYELDGFYYD